MSPIYFKNQHYTRAVITSIYLLLLVNLTSFGLSLWDISYLRKIIHGIEVSQSQHDFYLRKGEIEKWVFRIGQLIYLIAFLTWFYRTYKNVYEREKSEAPYKPVMVPFSYIIPFFNLYGPHMIMKYIWWGNAESVDDMQKGYRSVLTWWTLTVFTFLYGRAIIIFAGKLEYADDYLASTYLYLVACLLNIYILLLTMRLVINVDRRENYRY